MPLFAVWNRKIDLIEGHRVSVICNDGRVYEGFGTVPCIGEDENGEETDAVRLDLDNGHFVILTESEIKSYKILDTAFTDDT